MTDKELEFVARLIHTARENAEQRQRQIDEDIREFSRSFDKVMVTLSAGAIAGSVTLLDKLDTSGRLLLLRGWSGCILSLVAVLLSFQIGIMAMRRVRRKQDGEIKTWLDYETAVLLEEDWKRAAEILDKRHHQTDRMLRALVGIGSAMNWVAIATLIVGLVFLLAAAIHIPDVRPSLR